MPVSSKSSKKRESKPKKAKTSRASGVINLRVTPEVSQLIDLATSVSGKNRSEFILGSARREAEQVLLDQRLFWLGQDAFEAFCHALDQPPRENVALKALLAQPAPWEV